VSYVINKERSVIISGTKSGGLKAKQTNYAKHGKDFYKSIGKRGGLQHRPDTRPFKTNPELAKRAGRLGGLKRWAKYKKLKEDEKYKLDPELGV
jgi:general stress protein YciG